MPAAPRAIVFDLDHTLVSSPLDLRAMAADLLVFLRAQGVALPVGVTTLALPLGISADGRTIIGIANNGQGFVIRLDPPADPTACDGDVNHDDQVDVIDLLSVITAWGACAQPKQCPADFNFDGQVNVSDLLAVISGLTNARYAETRALPPSVVDYTSETPCWCAPSL